MHLASRSQRGATLALAVACAFLITVIGIAYFSMSMILGGAKEFRHAVDAGTLATARKALTTPAVDIEPPPQLGITWCIPAFNAVADPGGMINLYNINRVAAQSLLVELNAQAMQSEGTASTFPEVIGNYTWPYDPAHTTLEHARQIKKAAFRIANDLGNPLGRPQENFQTIFQQVSSSNSVRMLGLAASIDPVFPWECAFVNRDQPSNVFLEDRQLPPACPLQPVDIPRTSVSVGGGVQRNFINGYDLFPTTQLLMSPNGDVGYFIPLRPLLKPNLMDETEFIDNMQAPMPTGDVTAGYIKYMIPNAWSAAGKVEQLSSGPLSFKAYAAAEATDKGFPASIPQGFVHVHVSTGGPNVRLSDFIDDPALSNVKSRILQRIYEIDPDFSSSQLSSVLAQVTLSATSSDAFILKGSDGQITMVLASNLPSWLQTTPPATQWSPDGMPIAPVDVSQGLNTFRIEFTPASGYNGELAKVAVVVNP